MSRLLLPAVLAFLLPATAQAATCTVSATAISFGTYIPSTPGPTDNTGSVSVSCSAVFQTVSYAIALNAGVNSGGSFGNRKMSSGGSALSYQIYTSSARTTVWGDGTGGTSTVSDSYACFFCVNQSRSYVDYGRLPGLQWTAAPGVHSDTITATVTFN
jgi:spore coat protein U-like protein